MNELQECYDPPGIVLKINSFNGNIIMKLISKSNYTLYYLLAITLETFTYTKHCSSDMHNLDKSNTSFW